MGVVLNEEAVIITVIAVMMTVIAVKITVRCHKNNVLVVLNQSLDIHNALLALFGRPPGYRGINFRSLNRETSSVKGLLSPP